MPAIPIYSKSPINASKASGVAPQTAPQEGRSVSPKPKRQSPTATTSTTSQQQYPLALPGARPSLPEPTSAPQPYAPLQPTPTRAVDDVSPPAPQPGAVPVPPRGARTIPPPPKAGERYQDPKQTPAPQAATVPYPAQMNIPPPTSAFSAQNGAFTTTLTSQHVTGPRPVQLVGGQGQSIAQAAPGYQQNASVMGLNSYHQAAQNPYTTSAAERPSYRDGQDEEGVWSTAKKWAQAAGEGLAAAESEVWKRINKE
jgi:hypothetical protein